MVRESIITTFKASVMLWLNVFPKPARTLNTAHVMDMRITMMRRLTVRRPAPSNILKAILLMSLKYLL